MTKLYIAFSIHGTNKFHVAQYNTRLRRKNAESQDAFVQRVLGKDFRYVTSRRPNYNEQQDGIKVQWVKLLTKAGTEMRSPAWVARRFKELEAMGWKIVQDKGER